MPLTKLCPKCESEMVDVNHTIAEGLDQLRLPAEFQPIAQKLADNFREPMTNDGRTAGINTFRCLSCSKTIYVYLAADQQPSGIDRRNVMDVTVQLLHLLLMHSPSPHNPFRLQIEYDEDSH